jgi:hypothetical protein
MFLLPKLLIATAAALAVAAPTAHAATDTVVATTAKPTPLAADGGNVLYSAWDGSQYRLTQLGGDPIDVAGSAKPFVVDLDGDIAVYPRDGTLYSLDLGTREERDLRANGAVAGSLSNGRLVYATRKGIYVRAHGRTTRVTGKEAFSLDAHNSRFAFSGSREWSHEPWLATQTSLTRLTHVPGGGASPAFLDTLNPTFSGNAIYWMLSREGSKPYSEIHRFNRKLNRDERAALPIAGPARGFAYDDGRAYYSLGTEIHEVTGLAFVKAPRIRMY